MARMIDSDVLKEDISKYVSFLNTPYIGFDDVMEFIDRQPTIEERKTGKWIQDQKSKRCRCDQCLSFALKTDDMQENLSDFCPVCGADMREQP